MLRSGALLETLPLSFAAVLVLMALTYLASRIVGRHSVIDVTWGLGFVVITAVGALVGDGDATRRIVMLVMVALWGLRLATHIALRSRGHGEDPRYAAMLAKAPGNPEVYALTRIYLTQAVVLWIISLPLQANANLSGGLTWVSYVGIAVWAVGLFFEAVGDWQLQRFRTDPHKVPGAVMDRGLWKLTRHPNYFGDATLWWGMFIVTASRFPGVLFFPSALVMNVYLAYVTGKPLLEKQMMESKPGYADYVARTSGFFPRPPKRVRPS
jgi:steroid 5-alpha reductase family enzyme